MTEQIIKQLGIKNYEILSEAECTGQRQVYLGVVKKYISLRFRTYRILTWVAVLIVILIAAGYCYNSLGGMSVISSALITGFILLSVIGFELVALIHRLTLCSAVKKAKVLRVTSPASTLLDFSFFSRTDDNRKTAECDTFDVIEAAGYRLALCVPPVEEKLEGIRFAYTDENQDTELAVLLAKQVEYADTDIHDFLLEELKALPSVAKNEAEIYRILERYIEPLVDIRVHSYSYTDEPPKAFVLAYTLGFFSSDRFEDDTIRVEIDRLDIDFLFKTADMTLQETDITSEELLFEKRLGYLEGFKSGISDNYCQAILRSIYNELPEQFDSIRNDILNYQASVSWSNYWLRKLSKEENNGRTEQDEHHNG